MTIALASDHAGFEKLKQLEPFLEILGHQCLNFGPKSLQPEDDYPDFIRPAAEAVASGKCGRGIILGGSGQGEAMVANRVRGIRCAVYYGPAVALRVINAEGSVNRDPLAIVRLSRQHNDANMLSLGSRFVSLEDMKQAVKLWLEEPFSNQARHLRRLRKLDGEG